MNTPYWEKAVSLGAAIVASPRDLPGWLSTLPCWGRRPVDLELPWWSYGSIRFLAGWLRPGHRVFEYGSGGSSLFVARHGARIFSVENNPAWHQLVTQQAVVRGMDNLVCELHPLADDTLAAFRRSGFSQRVRSETWDAIIIDCHCGFGVPPYGVIRPAALADALPQVKPGGLIVFDDSWMYPELLAPRPGWRVRDFRGLGPCRYGVTSTAIFQRRE